MPDEQKKQRLNSIKRVSERLATLSFPPLLRPSAPDHAPTRDLVDWAIRVYCYSLLSHYREMLDSFLDLTAHGRIPAAFPVARCLYELGAHSYYANKHVTQYLRAQDVHSTWGFLTDITLGSRWMRESAAQGGERHEESSFPMPREIAKVIRCFNEYTKTGHAIKSYSFLSEYCHPSMPAFSQYHDMGEGNPPWVKFGSPPRNPTDALVPSVSISLTVVLEQLLNLLIETDEADVAREIKSILVEWANLHQGLAGQS